MGLEWTSTPPVDKARRRLKVAILCSFRAPGLVQLLNTDHRRGLDYDIVCCLTSSDTFVEEVRVERRGVPCLSHPIGRFCHDRGASVLDLQARAAYDAVTLERLAPYNPDVLVLDGYLLLLTAPVLEAFDGRILNIHHSDLTARGASGGPRYPGLRAVRDALLAGEVETRASAHVVTDGLDAGPVILRSWSFPVPPAVAKAKQRADARGLRAAIWAHQEWMLRDGWAPMLKGTIELAGRALEHPRRPLAVARLGLWTVQADGTLTRDIGSGRLEPRRGGLVARQAGCEASDARSVGSPR